MGRMHAAAAGALAAALALSLAPADASAGPVTTDRDALAAKVVKRVNAVRKSRGLRPLKTAPLLVGAADRHARSMGRSSYFRHDLYTPTLSRDWTPFDRWIGWFWPGPGFARWSAGENLAWGAPRLGARRTVRSWLRSPGHRANLLARSWRHVGIAAVRVRHPQGYFRAWDEVTIVVAEFGRRR